MSELLDVIDLMEGYIGEAYIEVDDVRIYGAPYEGASDAICKFVELFAEGMHGRSHNCAGKVRYVPYDKLHWCSLDIRTKVYPATCTLGKLKVDGAEVSGFRHVSIEEDRTCIIVNEDDVQELWEYLGGLLS